MTNTNTAAIEIEAISIEADRPRYTFSAPQINGGSWALEFDAGETSLAAYAYILPEPGAEFEEEVVLIEVDGDRACIDTPLHKAMLANDAHGVAAWAYREICERIAAQEAA